LIYLFCGDDTIALLGADKDWFGTSCLPATRPVPIFQGKASNESKDAAPGSYVEIEKFRASSRRLSPRR
jgi:hypothetical protein